MEILPEIIKYGGSVAVIYLLIMFVNALSNLLQARTSNGQGKDIQDLKKKVNNEFSHELQEVRADINELWKETRKHGEAIARIETKLNGRN